jgi:hypothetical protein
LSFRPKSTERKSWWHAFRLRRRHVLMVCANVRKVKAHACASQKACHQEALLQYPSRKVIILLDAFVSVCSLRSRLWNSLDEASSLKQSSAILRDTPGVWFRKLQDSFGRTLLSTRICFLEASRRDRPESFSGFFAMLRMTSTWLLAHHGYLMSISTKKTPHSRSLISTFNAELLRQQ